MVCNQTALTILIMADDSASDLKDSQLNPSSSGTDDATSECEKDCSCWNSRIKRAGKSLNVYRFTQSSKDPPIITELIIVAESKQEAAQLIKYHGSLCPHSDPPQMIDELPLDSIDGCLFWSYLENRYKLYLDQSADAKAIIDAAVNYESSSKSTTNKEDSDGLEMPSLVRAKSVTD